MKRTMGAKNIDASTRNGTMCLVYRSDDERGESWMRERIEVFALIGEYTFIFLICLCIFNVLQILLFYFLKNCVRVEIVEWTEESIEAPREKKDDVPRCVHHDALRIEKVMEENAKTRERNKKLLEHMLDPRFGTPSVCERA